MTTNMTTFNTALPAAPTQQPITVPIAPNMHLDAGTLRVESAESGLPTRVITPPARPMFWQLVDYLESLPPTGIDAAYQIKHQSVAVTALCLRWGTYFAVLADQTKPLWKHAGREEISHVTDPEMMRINIESSAALAALIDMMRSDRRRFHTLLQRAIDHLPMPQKQVGRDKSEDRLASLALAPPDARAKLVAELLSGQNSEKHKASMRHPTRTIANALINVAWRNNVIEDIHAGMPAEDDDLPLDKCRFTLQQYRQVIRNACAGLGQGIYMLDAALGLNNTTWHWEEFAVPYGAANWPWMVAPSGWSLTEVSCVVHLGNRGWRGAEE